MHIRSTLFLVGSFLKHSEEAYCAYSRIDRIQVTQWFRVFGSTSSDIRSGSTQIWLTVPRRKRSLILSESHVQNSKLMMKTAEAGMVNRFVSKVVKPADFSWRVRYYSKVSNPSLRSTNFGLGLLRDVDGNISGVCTYSVHRY